MDQATIYGVSDVGFAAGRRLASAGLEVTIADESLKTAVRLPKADSAVLSTLFGEDTLSPIVPLSECISRSAVLVFSPKLKSSGAEGRAEQLLRLKEVGQSLGKGCIVLNVVPLSLGGNKSFVGILEEQSGLKAGTDFTYVYAPASSEGGSPVGGIMGKPLTKKLSAALGLPSALTDVDTAELMFVGYTLRKYLEKAVQASMYRDLSVTVRPDRTLYIDDLSKGFFEVQLLMEGLQQGDPLLHFAAGAMRSLSSYMKILESFIRLQVRNRGLKAIRSRILVLWSIDQFEMKAEKSRLLSMLLAELREVFGEVEYWNPHDPEGRERSRPLLSERYQVVVTCSAQDSKLIDSSRPSPGQVVVTATLPPEVA
ncbi:MAG TPA: hypothetical protein VMS77_00695 [Conexivisphaerales archaeon]|nr:hypothetical protein [Conexivisphaerales archaeon]